MDINNLLRGVGTSPSKALNQPEPASLRKSTNDKETGMGSDSVKTEKVTITDTTSRLRQLSQKAAQQQRLTTRKLQTFEPHLQMAATKCSQALSQHV